MRRMIGVLGGAVLAWSIGSARAQEVDVTKAVTCMTLIQQFGDSLGGSKADDAAKKAATEALTVGRKACMEKDYDNGVGKVREGITLIGGKPIR